VIRKGGEDMRGNGGRGELKRYLGAYRRHLVRLKLEDNKHFIRWLSRAFTAEEFAVIIDSEIDRRSLWEVFLAEMFGP
jgi:hypothetical protein